MRLSIDQLWCRQPVMLGWRWTLCKRGWARVRLVTMAYMVAVAVNLLAMPAHAAPGNLDLSFGIGGKVTTNLGTSANTVAIQDDGKIIAAGSSDSGDFALVRYHADGSLDATFGIGGKVTTDVGIFDVANAITIQTDGKIVAVGSTAPEGFCCQFALARYNTNGSLDVSFGIGGTVTTNFSGDAEAFAVAIQTDGKIIAAGRKMDAFGNEVALARYNTNGSLDVSFGVGGKVTTAFGGLDNVANGVVIQEDDKIVVAGTGGPNIDVVLARYTPNGSLDPTFGIGGQVTTDFGGSDAANALAIQADGKIVTAGYGGFFTVFALARYNTNGSLDITFDGDGMVTTGFFGENVESATGVAIQTNKKIIAVGQVFSGSDASFALARYNSDGSLDTTFGTGGKVTTDFGNPNDVGVLCPSGSKDCSNDSATDVAIQSDGKIVVVGGAGPCNPPCTFALARYLGDPSTPSTSFRTFRAKLETGGHHAAWKMEAHFTLGAHSDGINPLTEEFRLQIGTFSLELPAGSFRERARSHFEFQQLMHGTVLEIEIRSVRRGRYIMKVKGRGPDLTGTVNPVPVLLTIGNDTGSTVVDAKCGGSHASERICHESNDETHSIKE